MAKVSIIVPAYNSMQYLPGTLASILRQTFEDFEVIVVNDGSVDGIETWFSQTIQDLRFKLVSQPNHGASTARNLGILMAQGTYIAFLDADDLWEPTKLGKQVQVLDEDPAAGLVYTWVACIDSQNHLTGRVRKNNVEGMVWPELIQYDFVEGSSTAMVRRDCFANVGDFDPALMRNQDWDMWLRIAQSYPFRVVAEPLVYYRQHAHSISKDWPVVEASLHQLLSRAFQSAPANLLHLKAKSYGQAYLYLSWKPLQHEQKDYGASMRLLKQARTYDPRIQFSKEFLRLVIAIFASKYLGDKYYGKLLQLFYRLRQRFSKVKTVLGQR